MAASKMPTLFGTSRRLTFPAMDRLYTTTAAGEILGGLHRNDVNILIRDRKLTAVIQPVRGRGTKPRKYIKASELERYMRELEEHAYTTENPATPPRIRRRPISSLRAEIQKATQYC